MKTARLALVYVSLIIISGLIFTGGSYAGIKPETLVGMWLFDEGGGDVAEDSSGNANHGEIVGAEWVEGRSNGALSFLGGHCVIVPASESLDLTDEMTVVLWINQAICEGCSRDKAVSKLLDNNQLVAPWHVWSIGVRPGSHKVGWKATTNSASDLGIDSAATIDLNKWYHIAGTYKSGDMKVYIDGVLEAETKDITGKYPVTTGDIWIGKYWGGGCDDFDGIIDEIGIFNKVLSKDDIDLIMEQGLAKAASAVRSLGKLSVTWGGLKQDYSQE